MVSYWRGLKLGIVKKQSETNRGSGSLIQKARGPATETSTFRPMPPPRSRQCEMRGTSP